MTIYRDGKAIELTWDECRQVVEEFDRQDIAAYAEDHGYPKLSEEQMALALDAYRKCRDSDDQWLYDCECALDEVFSSKHS